MALDNFYWDASKPVNGTLIPDGPQAWRYVVGNVETLFGSEHHTFPDASNTGGWHLPGSANIFVEATVPLTRVDTSAFDSTDIGRLWYDTTAEILKILTAVDTDVWLPVPSITGVNVFTGANTFEGINTFSGVSNFTAAANFTGGVDVGDTVISSVLDPVNPQDAATKAYADIERGYIKLVDSKSTGVDGGTFIKDIWQTRAITEESDIGDNVSVSSNVITLVAGTYECSISCPGFAVDNHQIRLRNTTGGGSTILAGTSENTSIDSGTRSFIVGVFTIAAAQTLEIQHQCSLSNTDNGFGNANGFGESEIYTIAEFRRRN